jgi:hypothetical protein
LEAGGKQAAGVNLAVDLQGQNLEVAAVLRTACRLSCGLNGRHEERDYRHNDPEEHQDLDRGDADTVYDSTHGTHFDDLRKRAQEKN